MPGDAEEPIPKRRRVTMACDSCRNKKSKCDGKRPKCGRCIGYGFTCTWAASQRDDHHKVVAGQTSLQPGSLHDRAPCGSSQECQHLVRQLCESLSDVARAEVEESLARIQKHPDEIASSPKGAMASPGSSGPSTQHYSQRYLGEVSDIHFFNLAKRTLGDFPGTSPENVEEQVESYDQDEAIPARQMEYELSALPDPVKAEQYMGAYFATIHIAYPFVPKTCFMKRYQSLRLGEGVDKLSPSWLGLLYAIFAIGAYYTSFPRDESSKVSLEAAHLKYFLRSRHLSGYDSLERSATQVSTLLAQCFYLLATSKTDRCWITLGLAVRLAQSVGLHVDLKAAKKDNGAGEPQSETQETRRRVWYSLYVLDRLVSLQLGRPPAISDEDCYVSMPSRLDDSNYNWDTEPCPVISSDEKSVGEYFVRVIEFSSIIGRVIKGLCNPHRKFVEKLEGTRSLDELILSWKQRLPRYLRFDIGHAFEKSVTFKRQRNLLAIKFHHIRALIHRPFLGLPRPMSQLPGDLAVKDQHSLMQSYERVCISEAQRTARLLHNVRDEQELIHDYPWWQMVSCLVCAGSILIVAENIYKQRSDPSIDASILGEDAETCLGIFEALSHNSRGAKVAMDMLRKLREQTSLQTRPTPLNESSGIQSPVRAALPNRAQQMCLPNAPNAIQRSWTGPTTWYADNLAGTSGQMEFPSWGESAQAAGYWPLEIEDSMAWSTSLFNMLQQEVPNEYQGATNSATSPSM